MLSPTMSFPLHHFCYSIHSVGRASVYMCWRGSWCVPQAVHVRTCAYAQVAFSHQLMWKTVVEKGIVPRLRQMLLLLSAFAFNLFFKPLEYPIYSPRLSELIFGLVPLKEHSSFIETQRKSTGAEW